MMDLMPILATLRRHKTAAGLIVLQLALTCAIVSNALFLIAQRLDRIQAPSGLDEAGLVTLRIAGVGPSQNAAAQTRVDLQALRQLPGVRSASVVNQLPYGNQYSQSGLRLSDDRNSSSVPTADYVVAEDGLQTLGLKLVEGRDFEAGEYQDNEAFLAAGRARQPAVILNRATAQRLFPDGPAVGRQVYGLGEGPSTVVGVVERLSTPHPGQPEAQAYAMLQPLRASYRGGNYLLRVDPSQREAVLKAAVAALDQAGPGRIQLQQQTLEEMRQRYYAQDRQMVYLLAGVCLALLAVTAFGIVGLASFWVQQRTRMIGTRRALGASRSQILRYFQLENFLLSSLGILLGMLGAYGISLALMQQYELPRLPWHYLPLGALLVWALGQLAVLAPARRAAALQPVAALRGA